MRLTCAFPVERIVLVHRGNHATNLGCNRVEVKIGKVLELGRAAYVEVSKPAGLPIANRPIILMARAKPEGKNGVVVARGGEWTGFSLYIEQGVPAFGIHRERGGDTYIAKANSPVAEGWMHLAGIVKEHRIELYVNGKQGASTGTPGYIPNNAGQPMTIGFDSGDSAVQFTRPFDGVIDEVKGFHAALSADEVARQASLNQEVSDMQRGQPQTRSAGRRRG